MSSLEWWKQKVSRQQRALAGDASGGAEQALAGAVTGTGEEIPAGEQQAAGGGV